MQHGSFVWADLSSFRPDVTRVFYRDLMGWDFEGDGYDLAMVGGRPTAAIYEMPAFFQKIRMPSFWMSYIAVDDVARAVEIANDMGGKVEVGPEPFDGGGEFALIRDPLGAGFTVYQGDALAGGYGGAGGRIGHALIESDAAAVIPFYKALFCWEFTSVGGGSYDLGLRGQTIARFHEIPDPAIRGKEQYWAVLFDGKKGATDRVEALGGAGDC